MNINQTLDCVDLSVCTLHYTTRLLIIQWFFVFCFVFLKLQSKQNPLVAWARKAKLPLGSDGNDAISYRLIIIKVRYRVSFRLLRHYLTGCDFKVIKTTTFKCWHIFFSYTDTRTGIFVPQAAICWNRYSNNYFRYWSLPMTADRGLAFGRC